MVTDSGPSGEAPPRLRRDLLYYDANNDFDDKKALHVHQEPPLTAGEGPRSPRRGPHPS